MNYYYNNSFQPNEHVREDHCLVYTDVGQDSTDVSRYEPALTSANLYSAAAKSFQQSRLNLESIGNPTDEVRLVHVVVDY